MRDDAHIGENIAVLSQPMIQTLQSTWGCHVRHLLQNQKLMHIISARPHAIT
jgi:hypothetical protein